MVFAKEGSLKEYKAKSKAFPRCEKCIMSS